jgi:probable rRNA maturation factor
MSNNVRIHFSKTADFDCLDYYFKHVIRRAVAETLAHEEFELDAEVSITFCDNEYIKKLNRKYRKKNSATDVLSFPLYDFSAGDGDMLLPGESVMLGDVVISLERAEKQAAEIGNPFLTEVAFLTVHSMLHLLGYDHELGEEAEEAQCAAQREIMEKLDI